MDGEVVCTAHSYQTRRSKTRRQICTSSTAPGGTRTGVCNGKYRGNHENMPVLKEWGAVEICMLVLGSLSLRLLLYKSAVNVPNSPVHVHGNADTGCCDDRAAMTAVTLSSTGPYPHPVAAA